MKVLAFNSSPNMENSNTALILNPFLKGMKESGAEIDLFYTEKLKINPCNADYACIMKMHGKCIQQDDMQTIYPKLKEADIIVFATPLYFDGMTSTMKTLIERLWLPSGNPFLELRNGRVRHPISRDTKKAKIVLVSNCGFWEKENFTPLLTHMKAICENTDLEFAGALLRPHGPTLGMMLKIGAPVQDVLQAAEQAGRQLVQEGKIDEKTLAAVSRELEFIPLADYVQRHNQRIKQHVEMMSKQAPTAPAK